MAPKHMIYVKVFNLIAASSMTVTCVLQPSNGTIHNITILSQSMIMKPLHTQTAQMCRSEINRRTY